MSSASSDPDIMSRSTTPFGFDDVPSDGVTVTMYYSAGHAPEILSIRYGRGEFDHDSHSRSVQELEKKFMALKHTESGKRKRRKNKTHKIHRK